jgi:uncharacterized membrane protein YebE (DUF533 family)
MPNFGDLLGTFLQNTSTASGPGRLGHALEDLQQTGQEQGTGAGGGLLDGLLGSIKGGLAGAAENPLQAGGLGALAGALFGGGGDSLKGAVGGGALAMLAGVALKALANGGQGGGSAGLAGGGAQLGLKAPETPQEAQDLEETASLVVRGMICAAKADGQIDEEEMQRIVNKLAEGGADADARSWVLSELGKPLDLDGLVADIPNLETAAEVYAASLLAVEVDTQEERDYLARLAARTGLNGAVVRYIHQSMGVPA